MPTGDAFADVGALYSFTEAVRSDIERMTEHLERLRHYLWGLDMTQREVEIRGERDGAVLAGSPGPSVRDLRVG